MLQSLKSMSRLYPLVSLWCPLFCIFVSRFPWYMHTYYTYESPIYKKLCSLSSRDKEYSYSQKSVQLFRVSFFCICFPRKVSNIWDSICLVFPLSAKNKASYVGKHWVENWLYSRSHREKKKKILIASIDMAVFSLLHLGILATYCLKC